MSSLGRRPLVLVCGCLALGILAYELMPRDEARIGALLNELCAQLNQTRDAASLARLRPFLRLSLTPAVDVHAAELGQDLEGVDAVETRAQDLLSLPPLTFAWSSVQTRVSGNLARVDADLLVTVRGSGEQHRDVRRTRVRLVKAGSTWQIEALDVDPVAPSEPEARP